MAPEHEPTSSPSTSSSLTKITTTCEGCGVTYGIGDSPYCRDQHAKWGKVRGFEPYFDIGLGQDVTGWGDVKQAMRAHGLDYRDRPSPGDTSVRLDKIAERRREAGVRR